MQIVLVIVKNTKLKSICCLFFLLSSVLGGYVFFSLDFLWQQIKIVSPSTVSGAGTNYFHQLDALTTYCLLGDVIFRVGC